jgi:hypothetical protein
MKSYSVKCVDNKNKKVIIEFNEMSNTKKYLETKYNSKYRFSYPDCKILVERIIKKPGKQMDIFDIIKK